MLKYLFFFSFVICQAEISYDFEIAKTSFEKFSLQSTSWQVNFGQPYNYYVKGYKKVDKIRLDIYSKKLDNERIASILIKDSFWYIINLKGEAFRYRPYEIPTILVSLYSYILRSRPQFLTQQHLNFLGKVGEEEGGFTFYKKLDDNMKLSLTGLPNNKSLQKFIKLGIIHQVDKTNYLIKYFGDYRNECSFVYFSWKELDDKIFEIDKWVDFSQKIKDWKDWYFLTYQPYPKALDEKRLVNIRTNEVRRLPIQGLNAVTATFSNNKEYAYVAVENLQSNHHSLVKIHLPSQVNKILPLPQKVQIREMKISPSNQRLAIVYSPLNSKRKFEKTHLLIMDLASNKPVFVSKSMDFQFINWKGDNEIIFQQNIVNKQFALPTITQLNLLKNEFVKLAIGHNPLWLNDELYFINLYKKDWQRINFKTQNQKYLGLVNKSRVQVINKNEWLIIDYEKGTPKPLIYNLATKKSKYLSLKGLWQ